MGAALVAFAVVFVAELGDRTQLLLLGLATRHRTLPVIGGLTLGYSLTNLLAVAVGGLVGNLLPDRVVHLVSGLLFLGFAVWTLLGDDEDGDADGDDAPRSTLALLLSITAAVFVSEIGDKSMLATATLATEGGLVAVWIGATAGIISSGALGVVAGRVLAERVSPTVLRLASAGLFTAFGVALLVRAA